MTHMGTFLREAVSNDGVHNDDFNGMGAHGRIKVSQPHPYCAPYDPVPHCNPVQMLEGRDHKRIEAKQEQLFLCLGHFPAIST